MSEQDSHSDKEHRPRLKAVRDRAVFHPWKGESIGIVWGAFVAGLFAVTVMYLNGGSRAASLLVGLVAIACVALPGILILKLLSKRKLMVIEANEAGLSATDFGGKKTSIDWRDVTKVVTVKSVRYPASLHIEIHTSGKCLDIGNQFPLLGTVLHVIRNICKEKGIECEHLEV